MTTNFDSYLTMTAAAAIIPPFALSAVGSIARGGTRILQASPVPSSSSSAQSRQGRALFANAYRRWFEFSSLVRFFVSGNIGNLCFYLIERVIYHQLCQFDDGSLPRLIEEYKESVSFFIGYVLQIVTQHLIHAVLVYGLDTISTREKYLKTLMGQFSAYGLALIGSTAFNLFLLRAGLDRTVAFFTTLVLFAFINYFLVGWVVRISTASSSSVEENYKFGAIKGKKGTIKKSAVKSNANKLVQKVRRGGSTEFLPSSRWFASSLPLHELVGMTGRPIDAKDVNRR